MAIMEETNQHFGGYSQRPWLSRSIHTKIWCVFSIFYTKCAHQNGSGKKIVDLFSCLERILRYAEQASQDTGRMYKLTTRLCIATPNSKHNHYVVGDQ